MPEDTQEGFNFDIPEQDWLERKDNWYVCRVSLGENDYVDLLSVSGELGDDLDDLIGLAMNLIPENRDELGDLELVQAALENGLSDEVWKQVDKMLMRYVKEWNLNEFADASRQADFQNPKQIDDKDKRLEVLKSLPIPVLARTLYGLAWHTRNFT